MYSAALLSLHLKIRSPLQLEEKGCPYVDASGEMLFRINLLSLQTIPVGLRAVPKFDYQLRHLLKARYCAVHVHK